MVKFLFMQPKSALLGGYLHNFVKIFQIGKTRRIWIDLVEIYQMRWGQKYIFSAKFYHFNCFFYSEILISVTVWMVKSLKNYTYIFEKDLEFEHISARSVQIRRMFSI